MGKIFISYSHQDKNYVHRLQEALLQEGFEVWIDDRIDYGTEWPKVIQKQLDDCDAFIVIVSEHAFESKWVQNEVARAGRKKKPIFPLLLQGDPWLSVEVTQYVDVRDQSIPTERFFELLSLVAPRNKKTVAKIPHSPSAVSEQTLSTSRLKENKQTEDSVVSPTQTKILILAANPKKTSHLRLDEEVREINNGLERSKLRDKFSVRQQWAVRPVDIRRAMLDFRPNIVHFCGHGEGEEGIVLENELGESHLVGEEALAGFFKLFTDHVECVLLNACYSNYQARAIGEYVDFVIGMSRAIEDRAAIEFSVAFYDALGAGKTIPFAYNLACNAMQIAGVSNHLMPVLFTKNKKTPIQDWGDSPHIGSFLGRAEELKLLRKWITNTSVKVVGIVGLAGIGKTYLSLKLAQEIEEQFEFIIWRRLLTPPPLTELIRDLLKSLTNQMDFALPEDIEDQIASLINFLTTHRCLLILDNLEAIMEEGEKSSKYRTEYSNYKILLERLCDSSHKGCLLITSREKPLDITKFTERNESVKLLELGGLDIVSARRVFDDVGTFAGSEAEWDELVEFYRGNPLALKLIAKHVKEVFGGNISAFLKEGKPIFSELKQLFNWHFFRLTEEEKEVLYWLAIEREPVTFGELKANLLSALSKDNLPSTLQSLQHRIPLEKNLISLGLQPVLVEYVTENLIENVGDVIKIVRPEFTSQLTNDLVTNMGLDVINGQFGFLNNFALIKSTALDYIREGQVGYILTPLIQRLISNLGGEENLDIKLRSLVRTLQAKHPHKPGYATGNILNLLSHMKAELRDYDFSNLDIWQAHLTDVNLNNVDFSNTRIDNSTFLHTFSGVLSVKYNPDGDMLAASDSNGNIRGFRVKDGQQIIHCQGHGKWVWAIAFNPIGGYFASGSDDNTVRIWDTNQGSCVRVLRGHKNHVHCLAFNHDGSILFSGSKDQTIRIWNIKTGDCIGILNAQVGSIWTLVISPNEEILACGGENHEIEIWNLTTMQISRKLRGHEGGIRGLDFHSNGKILVSGSDDHSIKIWDIEKERCLKSIIAHSNIVWSVVFSPNGNKIASSGDDHKIRIWDTNNWECLQTLDKHTSRVYSVSYSPDGNTLASGSIDETIRIWDPLSGDCIRQWKGCSNWVLTLGFDPQGKYLVSGSDDQKVRLWDVEQGECLKTLGGHTNWVWATKFSPDGKYFVSGGEDQMIRVWKMPSGENIGTWRAHNLGVWAVDFLPNSTKLVSGGGDNKIKLWDTKTAECIEEIDANTRWVWSISLDLNGDKLALGSENHAVVLRSFKDRSYGQLLVGHSNWVRTVAFSKVKNLLASGSDDKTVKVWDINLGEPIQTFAGHEDVINSVAFSPDDSLVASSSEDQTIRFWDIYTGKCVNILRGHNSGVGPIVFSPNGRTLASGSGDESIKLWEVTDGKCIKTLTPLLPYEGLRISGVKGLTQSQRQSLINLGAIE